MGDIINLHERVKHLEEGMQQIYAILDSEETEEEAESEEKTEEADETGDKGITKKVRD